MQKQEQLQVLFLRNVVHITFETLSLFGLEQ